MKPFRSLLSASLLVAGLVAAPAAHADSVLAGKTIVVDAGHGGKDIGAIENGLQEKQLTLPIAVALQGLLQGRGARVIMTRTSDVALGAPTENDLRARVTVAQQNKASAFVSVHINSLGDPDYTGASTFFAKSCGFHSGVSLSSQEVGRGYALASRVQRSLVGATGEIDRGTRSEIFWVLGNPGIPAVLVETGFMSNKATADKLATSAYQAKVAQAIADGVVAFLTSADATGSPAPPASAVTPCSAPPAPSAQPAETWVQTFLPAGLMSGADPQSVTFTTLPPFFHLKVLGQRAGYMYVQNPETNGPGYVDVTRVGPSGPPPAFQPFWVQNFNPTAVWSAKEGGVRFGTAPRWNRFQVLEPQTGPRLFVQVSATNNVAYVDAADVGPSGPP